jgi:disulfide bond formation protein DsbB
MFTALPPERLGSMNRHTSIAGYGAALAVTPYLLIKIAWTFGVLVPTEEMNETSWRAINATTAVIAAGGILLALAFCRPWGLRLPAWLVALPVWVGTGLLIPMVFLAPVLGPAAIVRDSQAGALDVWAYEQIFVMLSLVGVGVGLPLALAGYTRARWPEAVAGPLDPGQPAGHTRHVQTSLAGLVAAGCLALGAVKVFWAAGGSIGLQPDRMEDRDVWWHLLSLSTGVWALVGAWAVLVLTSRRGSRKFLPPMAAAWVSSGMLFSYNLFFALRPDSALSPEHPVARTLTTEAGIVLGVVMGVVILLVLHDRRLAGLAAAVPEARRWPQPV